MSSAANITDSLAPTTEAALSLSSRPNPVALETPVNATGARPSQKSGQRDLFSEDTITLVVFPDGCVIQLSAAVVPGQLLFLTHKRTSREVVCQVIRKRNYRPTTCYVELEFTEPTPEFWGVAFPALVPSAAAPQPPPLAAAEVQSAETTTDDPGPESRVPLVNKEDVERLRQEVEELRSQLESLLQNGAAETSAEQPKETLAPPPPSVPDQHTAASSSPAPHIPMALPKREVPAGPNQVSEFDPFEALLPKPELDFSTVGSTPAPAWTRVLDTNIIPKPGQALRVRLQFVAVAGMILSGFLIAAWMLGWVRIPFLGTAPSVVARLRRNPATISASTTIPGLHRASAPATTAAGTTTPVPPNSAPAPANPGHDSSSSAAPGLDANLQRADSQRSTSKVTPETPPSENEAIVASSTPVPKRAIPGGKSPATSPAQKHPREVSPAPAVPATPDTIPSDAPVIPPKLLKSVSAVYPPQAMLNYITGDVRIDAVVEPTGRVGTMKVIVGPAPLREAAMEALKQYEYAPATQSGRPVPAHVMVTVKFWFNP